MFPNLKWVKSEVFLGKSQLEADTNGDGMIEYDEFLNYFHSHEAHIDEDSLASLGSVYIYIPIIYLLQKDQNAGFSWPCWIARGFFGVLAGSKKLKKALCFSLKQEIHEVHLSILVLASSAQRKFRMSQSTVICCGLGTKKSWNTQQISSFLASILEHPMLLQS